MAAGLEVRGLDVRLDGTPVLHDVGLAVPAGQVLAVLGPSGCGKSTLLRAVAGIDRPSRGSVLLDGEPVDGVPVHRRGIALMFQDGQLFPHLDVAGNVAYPLRLRRVARRERAARVAELLELVGVPGLGDRDVTTLSGGERQRVALARALAVRPRLLMLDEPLSALDRDLRERLAADLRGILAGAGVTALLVTHDHDEAFAVADRMALLRAGRLVQEGTVAEVWQHPADAEAARFLGYARVVDGPAAAALVAATDGRLGPGGVALRRSALAVDAAGRLAGRVVSSRATPEVHRLVVRLEGEGSTGSTGSTGALAGLELDAVAPTDRPVAVGERVRLRLDVTRIAPVPGVTSDVRARGGGRGASASVD